jgi:molecular chaperone Hsp33
MSPVPFSSGDAPEGAADQPPEDDNWVKARLLTDTVEAHELLDPTVSSETLLYRLYHEDGVTVYPETHLARHCTCSAETVTEMLKRFPASDRADMVENGEIKVTCEFCSTSYRFKPEELG